MSSLTTSTMRCALACAALALGCALDAAFAGTATSGVEIASPSERQVFQRDAEGFAKVTIAGRVPDSVPIVRLRVHLADGGELPESEVATEVVVDAARSGRQFATVLRVPQGGWHTLEIGASIEGGATAVTSARVERFGVGDLFVIAGQSNSTNDGEVRFTSQDDLVSAFDGSRWSVAADPMPGTQDDTSAGSPWPVFGHLIQSSTGVPVGLASVGCEGTSIRGWQPGIKRDRHGRQIELYEGLRQRVATFGSLRAILWHQGESDASGNTTAAQYVACFETLATTLRRDTGCTAPWIVARATYLPDTSDARRRVIRDAQTQIWTRRLALQGPDTDDMQGPLRHSSDHVHFSRAGLEVHAQRWYAMVWSQLFVSPALSMPR